MKRIISIFLVFVLAFSCIVPVYATEVTETVTYTFDNGYPDLEVEAAYTDLMVVYLLNFEPTLRVYDFFEDVENPHFYPNSVKWNYIWMDITKGYSFKSYSLKGDSWNLEQSMSWATDTYLNIGSVPVENIVYSSVNVTKGSSFDSDILFEANYDIEALTGNAPEEDIPEDTNDSWGEEDKGWLGGLFSDLKDLWNSLYSRFVTFLEKLIGTLTSSVGNFITSATSSISTFINNAVSSISGFIDGVISVINSVSSSIGEWIAGVVSEIQAIYTGITDFLVSLWSDMWTSISEFFENLFIDITEYFANEKAKAEAIADVFTSFFDSIGILFSAVFNYDYQSAGGVVENG